MLSSCRWVVKTQNMMPPPKVAMVTADIPIGVDQLNSDPLRPSRARELLSTLVLVLVLVLVAVAVVVSYNWRPFIDSIHKIGAAGFVLRLAAILVGIVFTYLQWRSALIRLDARLGVFEGARVFFVSQSGKYLPGSVCPAWCRWRPDAATGPTARRYLPRT